MDDRVSVVIASKDRPFYLNQAVKSVLSQTHPIFEIIIVDDGSCKELLRQINEVNKLSPKIKIFYLPENRGPSSARNFAIDKAVGEFIIFLDDDDLIHPKMIESCMSIFDDEVDIVSSWFVYLFSSNEPIKFVEPIYQTHCNNLEMRPFNELLCYTHPIHSFIIRRCSLKNVRFPEDLRVGEDKYFWLSLASQGCRFKCNKKTLAFYRRHNANQTWLSDYNQHLLAFLQKLLLSGMLHDSEDIFFIYSLIALTLLRQKSLLSVKYLINMTKYPRYYPKYIVLYLNLILRKNKLLRRI
ncbi:MAG: glycosyltransferase family 2 protein [Methanothrix sp.]|nr:glycosyltransferase family 2 protein [Methanothrix sp.]MDD4446380.1 glycosyltransferase family 2 protein [Methanothrix sp.]